MILPHFIICRTNQVHVRRPSLKTTIVAVFIANEENGMFKGVGVDQLSKEGYLNDLKKGPVFWIDAADSQPCLGTAGMVQWRLTVFGKLFHSGMPHKTINAIEMGMDVVTYIQENFYKDFPRHPQEDVYNFPTSSSLKPTQISCTPGSLNQTPPWCRVEGDIRLAPFYNVADARAAFERYVASINEDPSGVLLQNHGNFSKYVLPDGLKGRVELEWVNEGENGIACNISSPGYLALHAATREVLGNVVPYSIGGSLPLVRDMQDNGFDVQISGYGLSSRYHADNECASISKLKEAVRIIGKVL